MTIAMPCLDEGPYIEACLRSVLAQDYPRDRLEVIVADGGSRDSTRAVVARVAATDPRVRLVDNPDRVQAAGMNVAIRQARGDVIVRMDVHCEYDPTYVRACVEVLERTGAQNVGGAQRPRARNAFQRAVCAALHSPLGGVGYRSADREGWVDTVFLGAFRRSVFEEVGLYDPVAATNEDAELNQRIHDLGGRVYVSREIVVHYYPRDTFRGLARQYFRYGRGRARTLLKHGRFLTIRPLIPTLTVLAGLALLLTSHLQPLTPYAIGAAALVIGAEAVRVGREEGAGVLRVAAVFPVMYVSHALGFGSGLIRHALQPDWKPPERLPPRSPQGQ